MTVVRCVTMQKNEATLLEPWILWHGAIFGLTNLTVIDNGSTDRHVLKILKAYKKKGVQVVREYTEHSDFLRKGEIMADLIRGWDKQNLCDFSLPMDCDELLALCLDRLSVNPAEILAQFATLENEEATLITDRLLLNVPEAPGYYRPQSVPRALFRANTIVSLDRGLHAPGTVHADRCVRTPFVYIHLHNRPDYEDIRSFARQKLAHLPDAFSGLPASPEAGSSKESYHLRYYFLASYEDFLRSYRDTPDIYAPMIDHRLTELGVDPALLLGKNMVPRPPVTVAAGFLAHRTRHEGRQHEYVLFDPLFYAYSNADVVRDAYYGIWPIIHFVDAGWREGRQPNAQNIAALVIQTPDQA